MKVGYPYKIIFLFLICLLLNCTAVIYTKVIFITNDAQFKQQVLQNKKPVLVQFSAQWCGACTNVKKLLEEIADDPIFSAVAFARVDIDQAPSLSKQNSIIGVPTFIYFENGTIKDLEIGVQNVQTFKKHVQEKLKTLFSLEHNSVQNNQQRAAYNKSLQQLLPQAQKRDELGYIQYAYMHVSTMVTNCINYYSSFF